MLSKYFTICSTTAPEEETMTIDFIDAASEQGTFAPLGEDERTWLRFLASQEARYIREQDEAAVEAEDYWGQADEACAVDPIG
jgi:hypothetical protein